MIKAFTIRIDSNEIGLAMTGFNNIEEIEDFYNKIIEAGICEREVPVVRKLKLVVDNDN